jgi:hypothetical protein
MALNFQHGLQFRGASSLGKQTQVITTNKNQPRIARCHLEIEICITKIPELLPAYLQAEIGTCHALLLHPRLLGASITCHSVVLCESIFFLSICNLNAFHDSYRRAFMETPQAVHVHERAIQEIHFEGGLYATRRFPIVNT